MRLPQSVLRAVTAFLMGAGLPHFPVCCKEATPPKCPRPAQLKAFLKGKDTGQNTLVCKGWCSHTAQINQNEKSGAGCRTRTRDPLITNQMLYQLS